MFNVLVSATGTAWETDQLMRFQTDRFKEYSDGIEAERVSLDKPDTLRLLEGISTLLMYERGTEGPNVDVVRYGRLHDIRIAGKKLTFRFVEKGRFSRAIVEEFSDRLGLDKFEHGRTHWAIKDGDIPSPMLNKLASTDASKPQIAPFISYAREDATTAERLYHDLKATGADPWLDREKLLGGQNWEAAIRDAIRNCTHFLALISTNSVNKRGFVQKELAHALEILDEFPPDQVFVIPVRLDPSSVKHERLRQLQWIDLFPNYDEGLQRLLASLGITHRESQPNALPQNKSPDSTQDNVIAAIRARAERDHPDDFSTRKYVIEQELAAWRKLEQFAAPSVPAEILKTIMRAAAESHPDDFSTRLYVIENEVEAWKKLQKLDAPSVPPEILQKIMSKAERDHPSDFGTRLYVIQNEITAWKDLYR